MGLLYPRAQPGLLIIDYAACGALQFALPFHLQYWLYRRRGSHTIQIELIISLARRARTRRLADDCVHH